MHVAALKIGLAFRGNSFNVVLVCLFLLVLVSCGFRYGDPAVNVWLDNQRQEEVQIAYRYDNQEGERVGSTVAAGTRIRVPLMIESSGVTIIATARGRKVSETHYAWTDRKPGEPITVVIR